MPLPVDVNTSPNYTPTEHANHHNDIHTFVNGIVANRQTASYILTLTDVNKVIEMNVAGANDLTIPPNSSVAFPVGSLIEVMQYGAGQTTLVPGAGVTIRSSGGKLKIAAQYGAASLRKIATDEWHAVGELTV